MATAHTRIGALMDANTVFAESWATPPTMQQMRDSPNHRILVLTCMDPRVVPEQFLGPNARVAVFRNAGGRATPDVVRTINVVRTLSRKAPGFSVMVVHHTDCGMTHLHDEEILEDARKVDPETTDTNFGCFAAEDLEKVILEDVETLKAAKSLKGVDIRGYVLVTETGRLHEL